jgi:multicomponent Na+:H+ antiporter subunit G
MSAADVGSLVAGLLLVTGSLFFLVTAVGMLRAHDAISRVNNLSPATGAGLPFIILGAALHELSQGELSVLDGVKAVVAVAASLVVSSIGSNMLGRAAYRSQEVLDPRTVSNAMDPHQDLPAEEEHVSHPGTPGTDGRP